MADCLPLAHDRRHWQRGVKAKLCAFSGMGKVRTWWDKPQFTFPLVMAKLGSLRREKLALDDSISHDKPNIF